MLVVSIVVGSSMFLLSSAPSDKVHIIPAQIEKLAKNALQLSKAKKQTHYLLISPTHIWISSNSDEKKPLLGNKDQLTLPEETLIAYKRSDAVKWTWVKTDKDKGIWSFSIAGICEEMSFNIEHGQSSAEISFHPLTAAIIQQ